MVSGQTRLMDLDILPSRRIRRQEGRPRSVQCVASVVFLKVSSVRIHGIQQRAHVCVSGKIQVKE